MSNQLLFPGMSGPYEWPPEGDNRLFLAALPNANAAEHFARLAQQYRTERGFRGRPYAADQFHVTLHHLGDLAWVPTDIVEAVSRAAEAATATIAPARVILDRAQSFKRNSGKRPLVLLADGNSDTTFNELHGRLGMELQKRSLPNDKKFKAHLTLLRDELTIDEEPIEPVSWTVDEVVLVHSLLGQSRYIFLDRWPLKG